MHQDRLNALGLLLLRVGIGGALLVNHGWGKLIHFGAMSNVFANPIGVGPTLSLALSTFAEFFCSAAIVVGFATRWASIPLLINFFVILFIVHAGQPGKREFPFLFFVSFATILLAGPGRYSWDALFGHRLFGRRAS